MIERESMVKYSHQSRNCGCLTRSLMAIMCLWWHHCIVSKFMGDPAWAHSLYWGLCGYSLIV